MVDPTAGEYWRTGRKIGKNLYRVTAEHPEGLDIGRMDTPQLAAQVVDAVNTRLVAGRDGPGWDRQAIDSLADWLAGCHSDTIGGGPDTGAELAAHLRQLRADRDHMARTGAHQCERADRAEVEVTRLRAEVDRLRMLRGRTNG